MVSAGATPARYWQALKRRVRLLDPGVSSAHRIQLEDEIGLLTRAYEGLAEANHELLASHRALLETNHHLHQEMQRVAGTVDQVATAVLASRSIDLHDRVGFRLLLERQSHVDRCLIELGEWEAAQLAFATDLMSGLVQRGANPVFLDLGAYWGLYSMTAARCGVDEIHAFEPDRHNRAQLGAQLFLNNLSDRVIVHAKALADQAGSVQFWDSRTHPDLNRAGVGIIRDYSEGRPSYAVDAVTLDEHLGLEGRTLVMKVDLEGGEANALQGMRRTVGANRVVMQIEVLDQFCDEILEALDSLDLRRFKAIEPDLYVTNMSDEELGLDG